MASPKAIPPASTYVHSAHDNAPTTFNEVLPRELKCINASRQARGVPKAHVDNLIGLAFSGGGIRSATFNLGILQALAQKGLLHKFDYLSTVSGGGYIGSWLAALTRRLTTVLQSSFAEVERALSPQKYEPDGRSEPSALHWLRLYSNYLTPHTGVVSGDTWAMLGTWLRNVILNQTILGLVFVSLFLLCQSALLLLISVQNYGLTFLFAGGAMLFLAAASMAIDVVSESPSAGMVETSWFQRIQVTATVMLPFVMACVLLNCALWQGTEYSGAPMWWWAVGGGAFYSVVWGSVAIMAWARRRWRKRHKKPAKIMISIVALLFASPLAGAVGACLLWAYVYLLDHLPDGPSVDWGVTVFGSGVVMTVVLLVGVFHLGLVGRGSMDLVREWWARLGGYLMLITLGWLLLAGTCAFAPLALRGALLVMRNWLSGGVGLLWLLHNFLGLKAASSEKTDGERVSAITGNSDDRKSRKKRRKEKKVRRRFLNALKSPRFLNALATAAPYVFLVGLVLLLVTAVQIGTGFFFDPSDTRELWRFNSGMPWPVLSKGYWEIMESGSAASLASFGVIVFGAALFLSWRVDVNDFSLHHFYRNRLVRCYLGASNPERKAEPFTGFDGADDIALSEFGDGYPGPFPILNAALNITGGEDLGYATRRAKSFVFTPLYCGYQLETAGEGPLRFRCDSGLLPSFASTALGRSASGLGKFGSVGGIYLGTAMAISGAAASPNMGYHTSPATAFFMALFDVRLGWWMGNPRYPKKWKSPGPWLGIGYLFSEVFAQSDQRKSYVYLSDGGHFENLAVYELIRRRCRLIVAGDADADLHYEFEDLLSLIEKARTDFNVRIEIDYAALRPVDGGRQSERNWVAGTIYYDPEDATDTGILILLKASMPEKKTAEATPDDPTERKLPDDVWRYYDLHETFPHQSTADQWFDELQFESYRALGEYIGCQAAEAIEESVEATLAMPPDE